LQSGSNVKVMNCYARTEDDFGTTAWACADGRSIFGREQAGFDCLGQDGLDARVFDPHGLNGANDFEDSIPLPLLIGGLCLDPGQRWRER
jgi:hypothetical protein